MSSKTKMTISRGACPAILAALSLAQPVFGQVASQSIKLDDTDLSYTRNAGWTYEIVPINVTDTLGFRINAQNVVSTGQPVSRMQYVLFEAGEAVPQTRTYFVQRRDDDAIAWATENNPNGNGPRRLRDGPSATPLTVGSYQLVVGARDPNGGVGDVTFDLELVGATFGFAAAAPPPAAAMADLAGATSGSSLLVTRNAQGVARQQAQNSFDVRDAALSFTATPDPEEGLRVTQSTRAQPGLAGNLYAWVEVTGFVADDGSRNRDISGYGLQFGADLAAGPSSLFGLSLGYDDITIEGAGSRVAGDLLFLQPYFAYRSGAWSGELTLLFGQGEFEQSDAGGVGQGDSDVIAVTFETGFDIAQEQGRVLSPVFGFVLGQEEITGTGGTLAGAGSEDVEFGQVSLGARLTQEIAQGEVFGGLFVDWTEMGADNSVVADALMDDGFSARLELGTRLELSGGRVLDSSVELGGIGSDVTSANGALRMVMRF